MRVENQGIGKSHAVASICDASSTEVKALRKELHGVEKAHQEKMKAAVENYNELLESNKTLRDQVYKLRMSGAGSSAKDSTKRDRQLMHSLIRTSARTRRSKSCVPSWARCFGS